MSLYNGYTLIMICKKKILQELHQFSIWSSDQTPNPELFHKNEFVSFQRQKNQLLTYPQFLSSILILKQKSNFLAQQNKQQIYNVKVFQSLKP